MTVTLIKLGGSLLDNQQRRSAIVSSLTVTVRLLAVPIHGEQDGRLAVVSDEDWMRPALRALSFLLAGRAKGFRVHELAAAKAWFAQELAA